MTTKRERSIISDGPFPEPDEVVPVGTGIDLDSTRMRCASDIVLGGWSVRSRAVKLRSMMLRAGAAGDRYVTAPTATDIRDLVNSSTTITSSARGMILAALDTAPSTLRMAIAPFNMAQVTNAYVNFYLILLHHIAGVLCTAGDTYPEIPAAMSLASISRQVGWSMQRVVDRYRRDVLGYSDGTCERTDGPDGDQAGLYGRDRSAGPDVPGRPTGRGVIRLDL